MATVDQIRSTPSLRRFDLPRATLCVGPGEQANPLSGADGILFRSVSGSSGLCPGTPQASTDWAGMHVWNVQHIRTLGS